VPWGIEDANIIARAKKRIKIGIAMITFATK
jgi:hypothetical protein